MADYQHFVMAGNLVTEPRIHAVGQKNKVAHFRLAASGRNASDTLYIEVECWGSIAEVAYKYLNKGDKVLVAGPLKNKEWTGQDLTKHRDIAVKAETIKFLKVRDKRDQEPYEDK